jgi:6,7-dimethyl-8-ribityllumazine synthase
MREPSDSNRVVSVDATGLRCCIAASSWYEDVVDSMIDAARSRFVDAGGSADHCDIVRVPGSFELPVMLRKLAREDKYDLLVAIGVIIRGETPHFDFVARAATDGIMRVALDFEIPIGFGLLTVEHKDQASARSAPESSDNKGWEAMDAAVRLAASLRES